MCGSDPEAQWQTAPTTTTTLGSGRSRRHRRTTLATCALVATLASCSSSDEAETPPTHSFEVVGEALVIGELGGGVDCLWIGDETSSASSLVFPAGTTTRLVATGETEVSLGDSWTARTGQRVALSGGWSDDHAPCAGDQEIVFEVGFVDVCPSPACD